MENLYHYCSNDKCFNILKGKNIRMGDISKSNDAAELELFFPELHRLIFQKYTENPFPFKLEELEEVEAMRNLVQTSEMIWDNRFNEGTFTNFVLCMSERKDCLSQWRGYADDGRGCCIGFSREALQQFCDATGGVLRFEKVTYVTKEKIAELINIIADGILAELRTLRDWIIENMTLNDEDPDTDGLLRYNFDGMIERAFTDSLRLKAMPFFEEQEWRIFLAHQAHKTPEWVYEKPEKMGGPQLFDETLTFLNNRIDFWWSNNDLIPFCPLNFKDFSVFPVREILLGPKNNIRESDLALFLRKYGYPQIDIAKSEITYR